MGLHEGAKGLHRTTPRSIEGGGAHRHPHGVIPDPTAPADRRVNPQAAGSNPVTPVSRRTFNRGDGVVLRAPRTRRGMNGRFLNEPHALRDTGQACAVDKGEYDRRMKLVTGAMMIVRLILTPFVLLVVVGIALGRGLLNRIR